MQTNKCTGKITIRISLYRKLGPRLFTEANATGWKIVA